MAVQRDKVIASAEKLVAKGKIEPAIKEYERLLDDNPNDVNTLNRIGDLWHRISRTDEAVKVFTQIADHYSKDGFFLKAIAIYKKINKLDPSKLDVYASLADLYAKQGLAMEAKSQYQVLADFYLKHGNPSSALGIYRKISELDPNSINVHVKLADLYSQNNQTAEALKEYDRVGRMLLKRGMLDEAVQVFRKALKIDAKNVELVESLVTALLEAKDYQNAVDIVEAALASNANNPRLLASLGRIHLARGDAGAARAALERGIAADPTEPSTRDALADLHLKQGNVDKALEMMIPLVERALARGERGSAVEMLNRVLRVDSGHTPTLERLVALYSRLNEETNILAAMNSLAEAHIAKGQYERAAAALEKLIEREPQNAQHKTKLQFVRSQMGGVDTLSARGRQPAPTPIPEAPPLVPAQSRTPAQSPTPAQSRTPASPRVPTQSRTPVPPKPMEVEEPPPSFLEEPVLELDLDAGEPIELDLTLDEAPPRPAPPPPPVSRLDSAVDMTAAELAGEAGDDLDFITEHLTEAEVFAKYGLAEKAAEHLRTVIERAPKHLQALERLYRILLDEGDVESARASAQQYIAVLQEHGDADAIAAVTNEFLGRGQALTPKPAALPRPAPARPAPPPPPPAPVEELVGEELAADELSFDLDSGTPEFDMGEITLEPEEPPAIEEEPEITLEPEPTFDFSPEPAIELGPEPIAAPPEPDEPFFAVEPEEVVIDVPAVEDIGEIDFYIEQELFDVARDKVSALLKRYPDNADLVSRRQRIAARVAAAAAAAPPPPPAPPPPAPRPPAPPPPAPELAIPLLSRDEIESELLSAIPDDEEDYSVPPPPLVPTPAPPPPPPAAAAQPAPFAAQAIEEQNLFADEDDFFDLAAELESELEEDTDVVALSEEEQSLEEIFKEFKKGVEQQLDSEDYDTHYNLGIAYKEMGLIDEAIGEFQLASKDPKRAVECASMLGLCFLEKGMPQLAIKWYRKGLEMAEITEEEHVGLLYDLGSAYMEVGDTDNAQKAFMEVYGMNTNYRDIVTRIKQLEDAKR